MLSVVSSFSRSIVSGNIGDCHQFHVGSLANSDKAIRNMMGEIKIPGKSAIPTITKSIEKFTHYVVDDMVRASEFLVMCHE